MTHRLFFFALALLVLATACAPKLIIRHEDPSYPIVGVRVDGEVVGFLEPNEKLTLRPGAGYHDVTATPRGEEENPWRADGGFWRVYLDQAVEITLLPNMEATAP